MSLKEELRADLKKDRYQFKHLAGEVGISTTHLTNILGGVSRTSYKTAKRLSAAATKLTGKTYTPIQFLEIKP